MKKYLVFAIIVLLCSSVYALGIRPAQTNTHFIPSATGTYSFRIVNDEKRDMSVSLSASGPFADLFVFPRKEIEVKADQDLAEVEFQLVFPESMAPGDFSSSVIINEQALGYITQGGISARLQLVHKVNLNVPVAGKYVVANLALRELEPEKINVITDLKNEGFEKVQALVSTVSVLDNSSVLEILSQNSGSLDLQEKLRFMDSIEKNKLREGTYTVLAEITYDNARIELSKKLFIGDPQIDVQNSDQFIVAGRINKYDVELRNNWNEVLEDQSFEAVLRNGGQEINRWKTLSFDIHPQEIKQIRSYIDATNMAPGEYTLELVSATQVKLLNSKRIIKVITEDEVPRAGLSITALVGIILLLLILNVIGIGLVIVLRRKHAQI